MAKALIDSSADIAITDIFNHNVFFYMVLRQKLKVEENRQLSDKGNRTDISAREQDEERGCPNECQPKTFGILQGISIQERLLE